MSVELIGFDQLQAAIRRNPDKVKDEAGKFLIRGIAAYKSVIIRNPWRMGSSGGGAPVSSGSLRDSHKTKVSNWSATIGPNDQLAPYAAYVHGIEGYPRKRKYQLRPWLDYAIVKQDETIQRLYNEMGDNILKDLAK